MNKALGDAAETTQQTEGEEELAVLRGRGWNGRARRGLITAALALLGSTMAFPTHADAARGHVFSTTFGSEGAGLGQLKEPMGLAIDEATSGPLAGAVYVADTGNNRVQWFVFNPVNKAYEPGGAITAASGQGTGTLTAGSTTIEAVNVSSGRFVVGQTITGAGIPAETTITKVETAEKLEISKPVESGKSASEVALAAEELLHEPRAIAVDNAGSSPSAGDIYVGSGEYPHQVVDKFKPNGEFIDQITRGASTTAPFELVQGIAVGATGTLWVFEIHELGGFATFDRFSSAEANEFEQGCEANIAAPGFGLAVETHGNLLVEAHTTQPRGVGGVDELDPHCKVLSESFGGESPEAQPGVTSFGIATEPVSGDVYVDNVETIGRFAFTGVEIERIGAGHLAGEGCNPFEEVTCSGGVAINGATSGASAGNLYAAVGRNAHIAVFTPEEAKAPTVEGESVVKLTDNSAMLQAELNPRSVSGEKATEYQFEYGQCTEGPDSCEAASYTAAAKGTLPASFQVSSVSDALKGLKAGTTYHFRVIARNEHGEAQGGERVFTTQGAGAFALGDGRQWEMVSPAKMDGALIMPLGIGGLQQGSTTQAAVSGGAIAYTIASPTEPRPAGFTITSELVSKRHDGLWSSQDISLPHSEMTGAAGNFPEIRLFSEDLSLAAIEPLAATLPLAESSSELTAYLRENTSGRYTPLVTGCPAEPQPCPSAVQENADVTAGIPFGKFAAEAGESCPPQISECGPVFTGATPDLKHVILTSWVPLKPGAVNQSLYEWSAGKPAGEELRLISLLPPETPGGKEQSAHVPHLGFNFVSPDQRGAVSQDGARVFFTANSHLYMRDTAAERTLQIDAPESKCAAEETCGQGVAGAEFQFASADGSRVFFKDRQSLTADASEYGEKQAGGDLYVCEIHEGQCALKNLTPNGQVLGEMSGASSDGAWVYFAANGALAENAVKGSCTDGGVESFASAAASCELYVMHREGSAWSGPRVVATVSAKDVADWSKQLEAMPSRVSPNGHWLTFVSQRSLTGYDNRDAISGKPDKEVYVYDAQRDTLTCVSCNPSGARPQGVEYGANGANAQLLGQENWEPTAWLAASVPTWERYKDKSALYQPRYLSDEGRLYFDSFDGLVPKDVNGTGDVYEFEPEGVPKSSHACSAGSENGAVVFRSARKFEAQVGGHVDEEAAGCVDLISAGSASEESALIDASEGGGDVFFISTARLSSADVEGGLTMYDAHECTSESPCPPEAGSTPPPCRTEASCKAAPSPQPTFFGPSGSATLPGPGNPATTVGKKTAAQIRAEKLAKGLRACRRLKKRAKLRRCERAVRRRYGAHATRSTHRRNHHG